MAYSTTIDIRDRATPLLEQTERKIQPATLAKIAAREGQDFTRKHFTHLNSTRANQMGGRRTNFYAQAARGTSGTSDATGANISVNQVGIRQRIQGGVILPKNGKFLTLPARAETYGKRASEFSDLEFGYAEDDRGRVRPALVKEDKKDKEFWGEDDVYFWLVPKVVQKPDPSVMPNLAQMSERILVAIGIFLKPKAGPTAGGAQ